jgi:hypothetical protein
VGETTPAGSAALTNGSPDEALKAAIDRWIDDVQSEPELRDRLLQVRRQLE